MKNQELVNIYNGLCMFQEKEEKSFRETGKKLLNGRIRLCYAMNKNKDLILGRLKPYEETRQELAEEYRDTKKEQEAIEAERELAEKEKREPKDIDIILKKGKTVEEYARKLQELLELETDFSPYTVKLQEFEGLDLDSRELGFFMFMIEE